MSNFRRLLDNGTGIATASDEELLLEIHKRDLLKNPFPLDVFNEQLKPFITCLNTYYDIPRSFIGLTLLSAFSTAIGTAYCVTTNRKDFIYLPIWAALTGMTSSGKSICMNKIYQALKDVQTDFDAQWKEKTNGLSAEKINSCKIDTVIFRDSNIPALIRSIMPDNPKGVLKLSDELMEWINGMNQLSKKEGTDEQFWLSSWNCSEYSGIRSGKQKFVVEKPFVNVIGGFQFKMLQKLFKNDRDSTGFVNRILFALPDVDKIAEPDPTFEMPAEVQDVLDKSLTRLYKDLPIYESGESRKCILLPEATKVYITWSKEQTRKINTLGDLAERETQAGINGKTKEYALRFAAILHLVDCSLSPQYSTDFYTKYKQEEFITADTIIRAIKLADYFFASAVDVFDIVNKSLNAPAEVLATAYMVKRGKSYSEIGELLYKSKTDCNKVKASRQVKRWINEYPRVFGAIAK